MPPSFSCLSVKAQSMESKAAVSASRIAKLGRDSQKCEIGEPAQAQKKSADPGIKKLRRSFKTYNKRPSYSEKIWDKTLARSRSCHVPTRRRFSRWALIDIKCKRSTRTFKRTRLAYGLWFRAKQLAVNIFK
jgi:hypothetical protein